VKLGMKTGHKDACTLSSCVKVSKYDDGTNT